MADREDEVTGGEQAPERQEHGSESMTEHDAPGGPPTTETDAPKEPVVVPAVEDPATAEARVRLVERLARQDVELAELRGQIHGIASRPTTLAPPQPVGDGDLTPEGVEELLAKDPRSARIAIERMIERQRTAAERQANARVDAITVALASSAEEAARAKFPLEFEVLSDNIRALVERVPDRTAWANPANWEQAIYMARGLPGAFEKLAEARDKKSGAAESARRAQAESAGPAVRGVGHSTTSRQSQATDIDPREARAMRDFGLDPDSHADRAKWAKWK